MSKRDRSFLPFRVWVGEEGREGEGGREKKKRGREGIEGKRQGRDRRKETGEGIKKALNCSVGDVDKAPIKHESTFCYVISKKPRMGVRACVPDSSLDHLSWTFHTQSGVIPELNAMRFVHSLNPIDEASFLSARSLLSHFGTLSASSKPCLCHPSQLQSYASTLT